MERTLPRPQSVPLILGVYLLVVVVLMVLRRAVPTPDVLIAFGAVAALLLGRSWQFARDWVPLGLIFIGWEAARGVAHTAGFPVHSDSVIAIERMIGFGHVYPVWVQANLRSDALDTVTSIVYAAHFLLPLSVAFWFWASHRPTFVRYAVTLMAMSFAQFAFALLVPVAPPRFAGEYGAESLAVVDVLAETSLGIAPVSWAYQNMIGNPVAAFPSLHAAYPVLAALFLRSRHPRAAWAMWAYAAIVWFAIVYTGHHYLIDAIGGGLLAYIAWAISWGRPEPRRY